jgi:hypothetical protein
MQTAYTVTKNESKEIVSMEETINYIDNEDFNAISRVFLRQNSELPSSSSSTSTTTDTNHSTAQSKTSNTEKQANMLKTIANALTKETEAYEPTDDYATWISNPEAVASFVNLLWSSDKIELTNNTWINVSKNHITVSCALHLKN